MLAMQYRFPLPADYDMAIVRRRIANFGHRLDACPQLIVKAYLYAQRSEGSAENLYAPFYLWNSSAGMSDFLTDEGFRGLSQAFGWPRVNHWLPWLAHFDRPHLAGAAWATCQEQIIAPYSDLPALRRQQQAAPSALASIVAFDPADWRLVRLDLWRESPQSPVQNGQLFRVGHLSAPFDHTAPRVDSQT
ncbi:DUF4865 family protein [Serratia marcescens]|uniref:DUF4865 family protein n=1 Tax=Serratia marcescens TaxID=615 RepID=UPI000D98C60D|nr:DUF4865 family protein [Serratia marcescens]PYB20851.1 DUF4865 domain-containing protein [Serratia marcescens]